MGVTVESSSLPLQQVCAPEAAGFNKASFLFIINPAPPPAPPAHHAVQKNVLNNLPLSWAYPPVCRPGATKEAVWLEMGITNLFFSQGG